MFAGGVRPVYSIDAMAVIYMVMVMTLLLIALWSVRPTQMLFKLEK
jgi:putative spermidine/putrescine transport system permease protein